MPPRPRRGYSFDETRCRRGRDVDIPWRRGARPARAQVPPALEWRIRELTRDDARVYARARARLRDGLAGYNLTCLLDV